MDEVCKVLHNGYTCMIHDDETCDPFNQEYVNIVNSAESVETMVDQCADRNSAADSCTHRTCAIESWFVLEILRLYFKERYEFDPDFMEANGWDASTCAGSAAVTTIA